MKPFFYLSKPILFFFLFFFSLITENVEAQITFINSFGPPTVLPPSFGTIGGGSGRRMKSADFNKDGIQDVVATTNVPVGGNNLAVALGTYTGVMLAANLYAVPASPVALGATATADFNGDGNVDIATIGADKNLYILKNAFPGAGFGVTAGIPTPSSFLGAGFTELETVDYDQDGDIDLLTVAQNSTIAVVILYRNDGTGLFPIGGVIEYFTGISYDTEHQIKTGIFDSTINNVELLYVNSSTDIYKISGLITGPTTINSVYTDALFTAKLRDMAIGDFNLDGNTDIAFTGYDGLGSANNFFKVINGNGGGSFPLPLFTTGPGGVNAMAAGEGVYNILARDLDNDGLLDIVVSTRISRKILIYKNTSSPSTSFNRNPANDITFPSPIPFPSPIIPKEISIGDFNSDGLQDIAVIFDSGDEAKIYINNTSTPTLLLPFPDVCANVSGTNYLTSNKVSSPKINDITVEGWFKMTNLPTTNDQYIFYNGKFGTDGYGLYVRNGSKDLFVFGRNGGGNFSFAVNASAIKDQWMHFALVKDKSDNWTFYLDGKQTTFTNSSNHFPPSGNTFFGTENGGNGSEMDGFLQEFRFWHSVLDTKTIREYSHTQANNNHPKYFTLNSYYPMHDNSTINEMKDVAFMTNKNALYKKATFKVSPNWSADIAPVGDGGSSITANVPNGVFAFNARTTTGLEVDFDALSPNGSIVVSRVYDTPTNDLSSAVNAIALPLPVPIIGAPISRTVFSNVYWIVENYGTSTNFPAFLKEITFDIKDNQFNSVVSPFVSSFPTTAPFPAVNNQANAFEIYTRPATSNNAGDWKRVGVCNAFGSVAARKPGNTVIDFGRIQLVIGVDLTILPIHLASFSGKRINSETNLIEWITTFEYKNQLFEIEKSFDAKEFFRIGTEKPTNKTQVQSYSFTDKYATEAAYYRLKQFDEDGKINYSKTIFINNQKETGFEEFSVYPNPVSSSATDEIHLKITGTDNTKPMQMQVFSTMGTKILDISGNLSEIEKILNQNLAKMPLGLYMIQIQTESKIMKTKFIKK